jgi:hypothetical protein
MHRLVVGVRPASGGAPGWSVALKGGAPVDAEKLAAAFSGASKSSQQGRSVYRVPPGSGPSGTLFVPHKNVIVFANLPDDALTKVVKADGRTVGLSGAAAELARKASSHHLWAVVNMEGPLRDQMLAGGKMAAGLPGGPQAMEAYQQAKAFAFWASLSGGTVECHVGLECGSADAAQQALEKMKASNAAGQGAAVPFPGLKALNDEVTQSLKYEAQGTLAVASFSFNLSTLEGVINDVSKMAAMFGGGFPGMGGPPPGMGGPAAGPPPGGRPGGPPRRGRGGP